MTHVVAAPSKRVRRKASSSTGRRGVRQIAGAAILGTAATRRSTASWTSCTRRRPTRCSNAPMHIHPTVSELDSHRARRVEAAGSSRARPRSGEINGEFRHGHTSYRKRPPRARRAAPRGARRNRCALSRRSGPKRFTTGLFPSGTASSFTWDTWKPSIGTCLAGPCGLAGFHPDFDRLFAFGIDPVGGGLPMDRRRDWPGIEEVNAYRVRVRESLDRSLESAPLPDDRESSFGRLLNVAIEHRLMHAETLAYMFHQMPFERKRGAAGRRELQGDSFAPDAVRVAAGRATLGLPARYPVVRLGQRVRGAHGRGSGFRDRPVQGHQPAVSPLHRRGRLP